MAARPCDTVVSALSQFDARRKELTEALQFPLNHGKPIPAIGLGTWQSKPGEVAAAVESALKSGYRHIDGAYAYQNEAEVGQGVRASGIPRSEIFLTSKLWCTFFRRVEDCLDETLAALQTDYLDLWIMHWPVALKDNGAKPLCPRLPDGTRDVDYDYTFEQAWAQMEEVQKKGKVKAIGVSNFSIPNLERLLKVAKVVPAVNQIECHPLLPQREIKEYCESKAILIQAYCPLGSTDSGLMTDDVILGIAKNHDCTAANVLISWSVQRGVIVLPKSVTASRIESNLKVVELDDNEMETLETLSDVRGKTRILTPDWPVDLKFDDWKRA